MNSTTQGEIKNAHRIGRGDNPMNQAGSKQTNKQTNDVTLTIDRQDNLAKQSTYRLRGDNETQVQCIGAGLGNHTSGRTHRTENEAT